MPFVPAIHLACPADDRRRRERVLNARHRGRRGAEEAFAGGHVAEAMGPAGRWPSAAHETGLLLQDPSDLEESSPISSASSSWIPSRWMPCNGSNAFAMSSWLIATSRNG